MNLFASLFGGFGDDDDMENKVPPVVANSVPPSQSIDESAPVETPPAAQFSIPVPEVPKPPGMGQQLLGGVLKGLSGLMAGQKAKEAEEARAQAMVQQARLQSAGQVADTSLKVRGQADATNIAANKGASQIQQAALGNLVAAFRNSLLGR